jgi:16S rRNA (cytidine1402-2'-O)-methyltransferase
LEILKEADIILCEDTRHTAKLLNYYGISKPLASYFQHSKLAKMEYIIEQLQRGKNLALVTDAGTPGISDPGGKLVELILKSSLPSDEGRVGRGEDKINCNNTSPQSPPQLRRGGAKIVPIPGACAVITALSVSGFPTDKFIFMGFPPHKKGREKFFKEVAEAKYTTAFYESVHRILKTLNQLIKTPNLTDRQIVVCRELTKMYESVYRGTAKEILDMLEKNKSRVKGEFVVVVNKKD